MWRTPHVGSQPTPCSTPRPVVAAAIVDSSAHPTKVLAAQRSYPEKLAGFYEFPGGKIELGEAATAALHREIAEELATEITLGALLTPRGPVLASPTALAPAPTPATTPPADLAWPILEQRIMWVWLAEIRGERQPSPGTSHLTLEWVPLSEAANLHWLPTNQKIAEILKTLQVFSEN